MTKVLVHIGPHKTGTSALQAYFHRNSDWLRENGVIYQAVNDSWNNHHPLAVQFQSPETYQTGRDFVHRLIDENPGKTILLSSEMFCEAQIDQQAFSDCLKGVDTRVIGYLRNPCALFVSAYNELVRDSRHRRTEALDQSPRPYDPTSLTLLRHWLDLGNLSLFPYDPPQWKGGTIYSDFMLSIGVDPGGSVLPGERANESLPFALIEALRAANIAGVSGQTRDRLIAELRKIDVPKHPFPMSQQQCRTCIEDFSQVLPRYRPFLREGFDESYLTVNPAEAGGGA